jgi:hypothetical protein
MNPLRVLDRDLNAPSSGIALDDLRRGGAQVGGDQRQVVAAGGMVPQEHDLHVAGTEDGVPQAGDRGGMDGSALPQRVTVTCAEAVVAASRVRDGSRSPRTRGRPLFPGARSGGRPCKAASLRTPAPGAPRYEGRRLES